jgi:hypothetical protein
MVYARSTRDQNIWSLALLAPGRPDGVPAMAIGSTRRFHHHGAGEIISAPVDGGRKGPRGGVTVVYF